MRAEPEFAGNSNQPGRPLWSNGFHPGVAYRMFHQSAVLMWFIIHDGRDGAARCSPMYRGVAAH
jgi:hypothetical protein